MLLLAVVVSVSVINLAYYQTVYADDVQDRSFFYSYPLFVFGSLTIDFFLNVAEIFYTAVALMVFSLQLEQVQAVQQSILNDIDHQTMTADCYYQSKERIKSLQTSSYFAIQLLTIVAGLNWIGILLGMLSFHTLYITMREEGYSYRDMINDDLLILPFLLKEALFFFYVLYKATSINTLDDKIKHALVQRCDAYANSGCVIDLQQQLLYTSLSLNAITFPSEFKLLGRRVTRGDIVFSIIGTVLYTITMVIKVNNAFSS
jgi:hypothetical protein